MTARARKKPLLVMPPLACQVPACGQEYPPIGDYADTDRAALLGGWVYRAGQWLCAGHRDHIPWWPGRPLLALPQREPGATTRAEFVGVVPRDVSWSTAALPAPEPDLEPLPPQDELPPSVGGWIHELDGTVCPTHLAPVHWERLWCTEHEDYVRAPDPEPLPQRNPVAPPAEDAKPLWYCESCMATRHARMPGTCSVCGAQMAIAAGYAVRHEEASAHPWQAAMEAELSEQALAGGEPLASLAPGQEDEEAEA